MPIRKFDLNIERVLDHWAPPQALREVIANALDEQALTGSRDSEISRDDEGHWHVRDWGRGLRYEHLTQNENKEKLAHPDLVIGKFGVGLKDALATFDRRRIGVAIASRYGCITTGKDRKHGFEDVSTLHALIDDASDWIMVGTDVILSGIKNEDVETAKGYFLHYSGDELLERTPYGEVLRRPKRQRDPARIYVNGLRVAEEPNFLFSYNITAPTKKLLRALNRERSHVGRSAYTDRVKDVLLACQGREVADLLAHDLQGMERGTAHDELSWVDVAVHACQVLNSLEGIIFVTGMELVEYPTVIDRARGDGLRVVVVPETVRARLPGLIDKVEQPVRELGQYLIEWDESFQYTFVEPESLNEAERSVWDATPLIFRLAGGKPKRVRAVKLSETMRLEGQGYREARGTWDPREETIVVKRSELSSLHAYAGTLLHELVHAKTDNADDLTNEFVDGLTNMLGRIVDRGIALVPNRKP